MKEKNTEKDTIQSESNDKKASLDLVEKKKEEPTDLLEKMPDEIIRPELNIEKHADFIFMAAHSKKVRQSRRREGWVTLTDGSREKSYLEIHPGILGKTPTTTTRRIYLALQRLYEEKQLDDKLYPDGSMAVSSREIMRVAMLTISGKSMRLVNDEIETLRSCMFRWANIFIGPNNEKYELLSTANILDRYDKVTRKKRKTQEQQFQAAHIIRFGEHIRKNLDTNKTKPVNYTTVMGIKGELALVLYTRLDIILADKNHYSIRSKRLFEDLNLSDEKEYKYPSGRKRKIEKAIRELDGKYISTGILKLGLEKTVDGADWKLMAKKLPILPGAPKRSFRFTPANLPVMISCLGEDIGEAVGRYEKNRRLYETLAIHYPAEMIYQAISEYKADGQDAKNQVSYFLGIMHRLAHLRGQDWIKPCPEECKHRPKS